MLAVFKREFASYFTSSIGYVFAAVCYLTSGILFYIMSLASGSTDMSGVFVFMFFVLMVFVPVLTMRLISEEKKQKTDQLILTSPVRVFSLVFGKFLSAYCVFLTGTCVMLAYGIVLSFYTGVSWPTLLGNYTGLALLGGIYVAAGIFVSSLTENQMIAAVVGIALNLGMFLMNTLAAVIPWQRISDIIKSVSVYDRFIEFTLGVFSFSNLLFFLSAIFLFLFLTVKIIEKRRY